MRSVWRREGGWNEEGLRGGGPSGPTTSLPTSVSPRRGGKHDEEVPTRKTKVPGSLLRLITCKE